MLHPIYVRLQSFVDDAVGKSVAARAHSILGIQVDSVRITHSYTIEGLDTADISRAVQEYVLHDPVSQEASQISFMSEADWVVEVGFRPGVTDNVGRTARDTLALFLQRPKNFAVYSATQYHITGKLTEEIAFTLAHELLGNELIQRIRIKSKQAWEADKGFSPQGAKVASGPSGQVAVIPLSEMNEEAMIAFSRENTLAFSLEEMQTIKQFYAEPATQSIRQKMNMPINPTDAEIEALAQTWSEHCKHKIFSSLITYEDKEAHTTETIDSLYKTCIQGATAELRKRMGKDDFCLSVFKDNAGVVTFTDTHDVCIKVETHNSPSALDPYGGAITGILGVNRDAMGTGLGANVICNTDVLCCASPYYEGELPPRLLPPRRIMDGVAQGVAEGGNKSGVPVVNGSIVFEERFLGKPLVYCGSIGLIPRVVAGRPGYKKKALVGDLAVMAGGRIGKDGIHGATFSSEELHEGSPATTVQIGDPITQRKLYDFMIIARDKGLYNAITDNGAGGLSSSMGEMAEDTNGCRIDLAKALLKYNAIQPWEILLSEAQERMTFAVPQNHIDEFLQLAAAMDVEASVLGEYTDSGYFHVVYDDKQVAYLPMEFLHNGVPQMQLEAVWERPVEFPTQPISVNTETVVHNQKEFLLTMLGRLNICSKEYLIRQLDHEVQGGSVVKPLVGVEQDGPADAAVLRPLLDVATGIVLSHGICPKFSDADTYHMVANAVDEAVRNAVSVGADPKLLAGVDNFCWCDPVQSEKTPDGKYKLAQLVRANKALYDYCLGFGVPCVSGKDSMKNDYTGGGTKISIPPTVLFSVLGRIHDVEKAVTSDFKKVGDVIYVLGTTGCEMAKTEFFDAVGLQGGKIPTVDVATAAQRYERVHQAMQKQLISACHDLSDGGFAVAVAEMALAGRLGANVDVRLLPQHEKVTCNELLYSESASRLLVTVAPENETEFLKIFANDIGATAAKIGVVEKSDTLTITQGTETILTANVEELAKAFKAPLNW